MNSKTNIIKKNLAMLSLCTFFTMAAPSFAVTVNGQSLGKGDCAKNKTELAQIIKNKGLTSKFPANFASMTVGKFTTSGEELFMYETRNQYKFGVVYFGRRKFELQLCPLNDGNVYAATTIQGTSHSIIFNPEKNTEGKLTFKITSTKGKHFEGLSGLYFHQESGVSNDMVVGMFER